MKLRLHLILLAYAAAVLGGASHGAVNQNFDSWPPNDDPPLPVPSQTYNGWNATDTRVTGQSPLTGRGGTGQAAWLYGEKLSDTLVYTNSTLRTPLLSGGIGDLTFWTRNFNGAGVVYQVQTSGNGTSWSTFATYTNNSTAWAQQTVAMNMAAPVYVRIRKSVVTQNQKFLGIDDVATTDPPALISFSDVKTSPLEPEVNDDIYIGGRIIPSATASNITATAYYRIGGGSFVPIGMEPTGLPNEYRTTNALPNQPAAVLVSYYLKADYEGPNNASPQYYPEGGVSNPVVFAVQERAYLSNYRFLNIIGAAATNMVADNDYQWRGVIESDTAVANAEFQFQGVTNDLSATNVWGDAAAANVALPHVGTAVFNDGAFSLASLPAGFTVFRFHETNLSYSVRQAAYQDFEDWSLTGGYTDSANGGWTATDAWIYNPSNILEQLRGRLCRLNSNGVSALRSPPLPEGIGGVSFSYRNASPDGIPASAFDVQISKTGGANASEWTTIDTVTDIANTGYRRYMLPFGDRYNQYVRILLDGTGPEERAALLIDEAMVHYAGAGVAVSNQTVSPPEPEATDPVHIAVDITPLLDASNLQATLYYRPQGFSLYTPIPMSNTVDTTYRTATPVPAGSGGGIGGAGDVEYYVAVTFEGTDAEGASPVLYPENGSETPLSYTIKPARVTILGATTVPAAVTAGVPADVAIAIEPEGGPINIEATAWYRIGANGTFAPLAMTTNATPTNFITATPIPAQSVPGTMIQYYVSVSFLGPNAQSPTNFPVSGAANPIIVPVRAAPPQSAFGTLRVEGDLDTDLALVGDGSWQGVEVLGASVSDPDVRFVSRNGATTNWGESDQPFMTMPVFGNAEAAAGDIRLGGSQSGALVFRFDEDTARYSAQTCVFQDFTAGTWPAGWDNLGTYTNAQGWIVSNGRRTTTAENPGYAYRGESYSCVLAANTENAFVRSPNLSGGIGMVSFWYRNGWDTNAFQPSELLIQRSADGQTGWQTIDTVTNVIARDYRHYTGWFYIPGNYPYVRILNGSAAEHGRVLLDNIVIARTGPGLSLLSLNHSPANPSVLQAVNVRVDITPLYHANFLDAVLHYRLGADGVYDSIPMVLQSGNTYVTETSIPRGYEGTVYYYVEASFTGIEDDVIVATRPAAGVYGPQTYQTTGGTSFYCGFETPTWPNAPALSPSFQYAGWRLNHAYIQDEPNSGDPPAQGDQFAWLCGETFGSFVFTNSYLESPLLVYGVGSISFACKNRVSGTLQSQPVDVLTSTDGSNWTTVASFTCDSKTQWQRKQITLDIEEQLRVQIKKPLETTGLSFLCLDDIAITYPAARVVVTNVLVTPEYPHEEQGVLISCDIQSLSSNFPAANIDARVYYRLDGQTGYSGPAPMTKVGDRFVSAALPPVPSGTRIEYYIEATFQGYYGSEQDRRSPAFAPEGLSAVSTNQYYLAPTNTPAAYYVRPRVMTAVDNFDAWTNAADAGSHWHQGWNVVNGQTVQPDAGAWHSTPQCLQLLHYDGIRSPSYLVSPVLTNGLGTLAFHYRNRTTVLGGIAFEVAVNIDEAGFETVAELVSTSTNWTRYSLDINTPASCQVRIEKTEETDEGQYLWIDDVEFSHIPTEVMIEDIVFHPGYPHAGAEVNVSCRVTPLPHPVEQASRLSAKLYYRNKTLGETEFRGPIPMIADGEILTSYDGVPGLVNAARHTIEFYLEVEFDGYHYTTDVTDRSPTFYPGGPSGIDPDQYYSAPLDDPARYFVRPYASSFSTVNVDIAGMEVSMRQQQDNAWYGLVFVRENRTNDYFSLEGLDRYTGTDYASETLYWGDAFQTRDRLPYANTMQIGGPSILVHDLSRGAYVLRFSETTQAYTFERAAFQDFDIWPSSPDYFQQSYSQIDVVEYPAPFDALPLSSDPEHPDTFTSWPLMDEYCGQNCDDGTMGWIISYARVISQYTSGDTSHACRLNPSPELAEVIAWEANVANGAGVLTLDYRFLDDTMAPVLVPAADDWSSGVVVNAQLDTTDLPWTTDQSALGTDAFMSLLARYQSVDTYYELRAEQTGVQSQYDLRLMKAYGGPPEELWSKTITGSGSIASTEQLKLVVADDSAGGVYIEGYRKNPNGAWVREVQWYDTPAPIPGVGKTGARGHAVDVTVDELETGPCAMETFRGWPTLGATQERSQNGWTVIEAAQIAGGVSVNDNDHYVRLQAPSGGLTDEPQVISPPLSHGIGAISFRYRKSGGNSQVNVEWSTNAVDWNMIAPVTVRNNGWNTFDNNTLSLNETNVRVRFVCPTNFTGGSVFLDTIRIEPAPQLAESWNFSSGTAGLSTPQGNWSVQGGKYLGKGVVTPGSFRVETGPYDEGDLRPWTTAATVTGKANIRYTTFTTPIHIADQHLVRIKQTAGSGSLVLDRVNVTEWLGDTVMTSNDWRIVDGWIVDSPVYSGRAIELRESRSLSSTVQSIVSPRMTNGVGYIEFRHVSLDGSPVVFDVERAVDTNEAWQTLATVTNSATSWDDPAGYFAYRVNDDSEMFVRIAHSGSPGDGRLVVDDLTITDYATKDEHSWEAYNMLITPAQDDKLRDTPWNVKAGYLNVDPTQDVLQVQSPLDADAPYIQSGFLEEGIGEIRFWYRRWDTESKPTLHLYIAPSDTVAASNWTHLVSIPMIENTEYRPYTNAWYNTSNHYVRFYAETTGGNAGRICLDDLLITAPFGAEVTVDNLRLDPEIPLEGDEVYIEADITERFLNPSNIAMTAHYYGSTNNWGTWINGEAALQMDAVATNGVVVTYRTRTPIDEPYPVDKIVQYYVSTEYEGLFSEVTSPYAYRDFTNPEHYEPIDLNAGVLNTNPYYFVFSCLPGSAWINEVNYYASAFYDANYEFVELLGVTGIDVADWRIELVTTDENVYDLHTLPPGTTMPPGTNGYGFYVFGDPGVPNVDAVFTNPVTQNIQKNAGVRLVRSMGAYEHRVCHGDSQAALDMQQLGYEWIGVKPGGFANSSLFLEGEGDEHGDFEWTSSTMSGDWRTPGIENDNQTLIERNEPPPEVTFEIADVWTDGSDVWMVLFCDYAGDVQPVPWYSTNLMDTNAWEAIFGATYTRSGNTYTQQFSRPAAEPQFYRATGEAVD